MNASGSRAADADTAEHRAILGALPAIAWCKRPDGSNEFVNRRWQDYTGIPEDETRGLGWQAAVHPDDLPKLTEKWAEIVASGKVESSNGAFVATTKCFAGVSLASSPSVTTLGYEPETIVADGTS